VRVEDVGNGNGGKDLDILGTSVGTEVNGQLKQVIDGTATATVTIDDDDKLTDVVTKINALNRGVTASILNDGTRQRLSITANNTGAANELLLDTSNTRLSLQEVSSGRDALLLYGKSGSGGVLISSSTNTFRNVEYGLDVTVNQGTQTPVTVNVSSTTSSLTSTLKDFVSSYNSIRDNLDKLTSYDATTSTAGVLFGSSEALQVDTDISHLITQQFFGVSQSKSLGEVSTNS